MSITLGAGSQTFVFDRTIVNETISDFKSTYFAMTFSGANEVPPNGSSATGAGTGVLNFRQTRFDFAVDTGGLDFDGSQTPGVATDNVTGMHIHAAPAGVNGPVIFNVLTSAGTSVNAATGEVTGTWDSSGTLNEINLALLESGGTYINIHTSGFPGGEIRGQIIGVDDGGDRIDLTGLSIGSLATLREITETVRGAAVMTVYTDNLISKLRLTGVTENRLKASDFIFSDATPVTADGSLRRDDLFGSNGNDTLRGLGGNDRLFGDAGNDVLQGGGGSDQLFGGRGRDEMSGGASADTFFFRATNESGKTSVKADVILDFAPGLDKIDVSAIDAIASSAGDDAFSFIGGASFTAAGQVRVAQISGDTIILFNTSVPADPFVPDEAEMAIKLVGLVTVTAADFIL